MEEFIKKEDGFTSWRAKINRMFGALSWLLDGSDEKSVLASENGRIMWKPVEESEKKEEKEASPISSLNVSGVISSVSLAVTGAAKFLCRIDADAGIAAKAVSISDALVLKENGSTAIIRLSDGLVSIGGAAFIGEREVRLPPLAKIGEASIAFDRTTMSFYGRATSLRLDLHNGGADFPYGLSGQHVAFPNGSIDGESYTGCAASARKLASPASIFGHQFDGTADISGSIENCTGLSFADKAEISFNDSLRRETLGVSGGTMEWSGMFRPKSLNVQADHYSEWYPASCVLTEGDVISLDLQASEEAYCKASANGCRPLAVVSSECAASIGTRDDRSYPACSRGRVSAKVEGIVAKGDLLVLSSTDGVLRAAGTKDKGKEWAVALEASSLDGQKLIRIHIL